MTASTPPPRHAASRQAWARARVDPSDPSTPTTMRAASVMGGGSQALTRPASGAGSARVRHHQDGARGVVDDAVHGGPAEQALEPARLARSDDQQIGPLPLDDLGQGRIGAGVDGTTSVRVGTATSSAVRSTAS